MVWGGFTFWFGGCFYGGCLVFCFLGGWLFFFFKVTHLPDHQIFAHEAYMVYTAQRGTEKPLDSLTYICMQSELGTCTADISHCTTEFCHYLTRETLLIK